MTNELEKQFFQCFGIKEKTNKVYGVQLDYHIDVYPQITGNILLELICILNDFTGIDVRATKIEKLKEEILNHCINLITYELNIQCPQCGMVNIDCGKEGYKTPKELRYEKALEEIEEILDNDDFGYCPLDDSEDCHRTTYKKILDIINKADCRQSAECFCEAKHADTFNADNQAAKRGKND